MGAISSTGENCKEKWIISVLDTVQLRLLHKFQLVLSSRHKVRFSKALTWYTLRIKCIAGCHQHTSFRQKSVRRWYLQGGRYIVRITVIWGWTLEGHQRTNILVEKKIPLRAMRWGQSLRYRRGIKSNEEPFWKSHSTIPKPIKKNSMVYCVERHR